MTEDKPRADLLYGAPAIADYLGVTQRQVRYLMEKGTLPSHKIGGKVCSSRGDVDAWLSKQRNEALRKRRAEDANG